MNLKDFIRSIPDYPQKIERIQWYKLQKNKEKYFWFKIFFFSIKRGQ